MSVKKLAVEFLIEYGSDGYVTVNELIEKLHNNPNRKFRRFRSKNFLSKILNILSRDGIIKAEKIVRRPYYKDRIYRINIDDLKQYLEDDT